MRTTRGSLLVLVSLVATISFVTPLPATATSNAPRDSAVGGGQHDDLAGTCSPSDNTCSIVGFSAYSDANGANPQGHVSHFAPKFGEAKGPVTCLHVSGNEAFILFENTKDFPGSPAGTLFAEHVVDNGNPASGPPDLIRGYPNASTSPALILNPATCFIPLLPPVPNVQGNFVVHDAP
jgi:hypothetical protein